MISLSDRQLTWLREHGAKRSEKLDRTWFARRPSAILRVRRTVPFEGAGWGAEQHIRSPFAIVFKEKAGTIRKRTFYAHRMPDQDVATLAALWDFFETEVQDPGDGSMIPLSPAQLSALSFRVKDLKDQLKLREGAV